MNQKQAQELYFAKASTWADELREGVFLSKKRYQSGYQLILSD